MSLCEREEHLLNLSYVPQPFCVFSFITWDRHTSHTIYHPNHFCRHSWGKPGTCTPLCSPHHHALQNFWSSRTETLFPFNTHPAPAPAPPFSLCLCGSESSTDLTWVGSNSTCPSVSVWLISSSMSSRSIHEACVRISFLFKGRILIIPLYVVLGFHRKTNNYIWILLL